MIPLRSFHCSNKVMLWRTTLHLPKKSKNRTFSKKKTDEESVEIQHEMMDVLALPIRAKPLFHNNHEDVDEFPSLNQKMVSNQHRLLLGTVCFEWSKQRCTRWCPRIDVQLVMDAELTSFQHVIEKPTPISSASLLGSH